MTDAMRRLGLTGAFISITAMFFAWGFICSNNDPLIVALRAAFHLSYSEALLTQLVFFLANAVVSLPAAALGGRIGPGRMIVASLLAMISGCLAIGFATQLDSYPPILAGLFVLAGGITALQVSANPLAAALGPAESSHFRLTLAQTFNSFGVVLGVHYGSYLMLGDSVMVASQGLVAGQSERDEVLRAVGGSFAIMAVMLALVVLFLGLQRPRIDGAMGVAGRKLDGSVLEALRSPWAICGALAIGLYVGAEVSIASIMINFLHHSAVLGIPLEQGGRYLANIYWGGALIGRLAGALLLTRIRAPLLLGLCATTAMGLSLFVGMSQGALTGYAALLVGLFNSIMFPTIFSITLERSGVSQAATSGLLVQAIAGGAILLLLVGKIADSISLNAAFLVPALAYAAISGFALAGAISRK